MPPETPSSVSFKVRVQPRASRNEVLGYREDVLRLRVTAPPEGGKANDAVESLLADVLGLPRGRVRIIRGHTSREKVVAVESLSQEEVRRRLEASGG